MGKTWARKYAERKFLHDVQGGRCAACSRKMNLSIPAPDPAAPTFDHVVPASLGGANSLRNYVLKHHRCNAERGNTPPSPADLHWHAEVNRRIDDEERRDCAAREAWAKAHPLCHRLRSWAVAQMRRRPGEARRALCLLIFEWGRRIGADDTASHWTLRRLQ